MKGDYSRFTFRKEKHYSGVRMQQGRVQLDSDWNEQHEINMHLDRTTRLDTFGLSGGPQENAGFKIVSKDFKLHLTPGRYYVNGILCENENDVHLSNQPDLPDTPLPEKCCLYTAYLDVWTRNISALEDDYIREKGLLGPDTTTRTKTVWQVKFEEMDANDVEGCPLPGPGWKPVNSFEGCLLGARARRFDMENDPCTPMIGTGYHRQDNHLYRIEIHNGGSAGKATYKWSRDNACHVSRLVRVENRIVTISDLGRGAEFEFKPKQWIEISDEGRSLRGEPGVMVEIENVDGCDLKIKEWPGNNGKDYCPFYFGEKPTVRIWDRDENRNTDSYSGIHIITEKEWTSIENGIEVRFESGGIYRSGDYWLIPARVATGDIEWPRDESNKPLLCSPNGIEHSYAPIAILKHAGDWEPLEDLRSLFPPITKLTEIFYIGGDAQDIIRDERLPNSLKVGVSNGQLPYANALVRFDIGFPSRKNKGTGWLSPLPNADGGEFSVVCRTNVKGEAECYWWPDPDVKNQLVTATLLDHACEPVHIPIRFTASITSAQDVAYSPFKGNILKGIDNVGDALDRLNRIKAEDIAYIVSTSGKQDVVRNLQNVLEDIQKGTGISGGGLASIIAELANAICVQDEVKRHKAIIEIPVKRDSSVLYATAGLILNLVRIFYAIILEFLDVHKSGKVDGKNYLGDSASIYLDTLFGAFGPPAIDKIFKDRVGAFKSLKNVIPNLLLYTISKVLGERIFDPKRSSEDSARAFIDIVLKFGDDFGDRSNCNGTAANKSFMSIFYAPLIGSRKLDHEALGIIFKILLDIASAFWEQLSTAILVNSDMKFDIPADINLTDKMEKPGTAFFNALNNIGIIRNWAVNDNLVDILIQKSVTGSYGATWLIYQYKAFRISHKDIIEVAEKDLMKSPEPDLTITPVNGLQFTEAEISGGYLLLYSNNNSSINNVLSIPITYLNTLSGTHDLQTIIDADTTNKEITINANITISARVKIVRGRPENQPMLLCIESSPYILNLENNEGIACSFKEQGFMFPNENIVGVYSIFIQEADAISEYTVVIFDKWDGQIILLGRLADMRSSQTADGSTGAYSPYLQWLTKAKLYPNLRVTDITGGQLVINHEGTTDSTANEPAWAFIPVKTLLPETWGDNAATYKGILNLKASDNSPLFDVDFLGSSVPDVIESPSIIKFEKGYVTDANINESLITVIGSSSFLDIYKSDNGFLPSFQNSIMLGGSAGYHYRHNMTSHYAQTAHSREGKYLIVTRAENSRYEFKVLEMTSIERKA